MSQSSSAEAAPPGAGPAHGGAGSALAPRNWPVACRLIVLVAIPIVLGLALTGVRVTDAMRSAQTYGRVAQVAALGQQVTGLTQALENERAGTAAFVAAGRPAAGLVALHRQYVITDGWAATVRRLVLQLGRGYPAQTRTSVATALASIAELPGLRRQATQRQAPALAVISGYSAATAGLFPVNDGIADLSGNSALISSVRALGSLSRMKDQASQQQAILGAALAEGHFERGAVTALTIAQVQQAGDLASFRSSATPEESWALAETLAARPAGEATAVEQRATTAGPGPLALGAHASQQWSAGMSYTVGWMRHAEQQLASWITSYARALQRSAAQAALLTGGAALAVLILVLLATMIMTRSMVRPLRRIEAAALDVAGARLPAEIHAPGAAAAGNSGYPVPVTPIDVLSTDEIGRVARALDQVHQEAVRLVGEEARRRGSVSTLFAGFFRRSHSLLGRLLGEIDHLELGEDDPERLASLFKMDHLATRLRRNSDSALVLAGYETPQRRTEPVTLVDVLRAAVSEIEQYDRVTVNVQLGVLVSGSAAPDTVHLLAELLENATTFSPATTQVIASGHTPRGGGALINITDSGTGMPEEGLSQLNARLADPSLADGGVARHMGVFAVAHLAARHGIRVVLRRPPSGGTAAEVYLPAALISRDAKPGGWLRAAPGVPRAGAGGRASAMAAAADPRPSSSPFAAGPEPAGGAGTAVPDAVPLPLGAPLPAPAPATSAPVIVPEPADAGPGGVLPIFESVESDYLHTRGRGALGPSESQAGQPAPSGQPPAASASWAATAAGRRAAAATETPAAGGVTSAGLPQRVPQASPWRGPPGAHETRPATTAEAAQAARARLASFQRGARRARAAARMNRDAKQPAQDD